MCKREVSERHLVVFPEEIRKKLFHFFLPRVVGFIIPSFLRFHKDCMKNAAVPSDKKTGSPIRKACEMILCPVPERHSETLPLKT